MSLFLSALVFYIRTYTGGSLVCRWIALDFLRTSTRIDTETFYPVSVVYFDSRCFSFFTLIKSKCLSVLCVRTSVLWPHALFSCSSFRWFHQSGAAGPGGLHQRQPHHGECHHRQPCRSSRSLIVTIANSCSVYLLIYLSLRWRRQCLVFVCVMLLLRARCHRPALTFGRLCGSSRCTPSSC